MTKQYCLINDLGNLLFQSKSFPVLLLFYGIHWQSHKFVKRTIPEAWRHIFYTTKWKNLQ